MIWKHTKLPTTDQHVDVYEKTTEFFDLDGDEVFTLTSFYNLDWSIREIHTLYNRQEFCAEFFAEGIPF